MNTRKKCKYYIENIQGGLIMTRHQLITIVQDYITRGRIAMLSDCATALCQQQGLSGYVRIDISTGDIYIIFVKGEVVASDFHNYITLGYITNHLDTICGELWEKFIYD